VLVPGANAAAPAAASAPAAAVRPRAEAGGSAQDGVPGFDNGPQPLAPERSLSTPGVRPSADFTPVRAVQVTAQELRGIELLVTDQGEQAQMRFSGTARSEGAAVEELQRTLRSTLFSGQLDQLRNDVQEELQLDKSVTISVAGVSLGLSLVYVLWLIRGGVLMGSYLSALPAWRVLDPLPVLSRVDDEAEEDDEALDAVAERSGNPLRSFG
jgi:hypothetical protein